MPNTEEPHDAAPPPVQPVVTPLQTSPTAAVEARLPLPDVPPPAPAPEALVGMAHSAAPAVVVVVLMAAAALVTAVAVVAKAAEAPRGSLGWPRRLCSS